MGHYRQYLIRGRGANPQESAPIDPHAAPAIASVVSGGGWDFTLTARPGSDSSWFMTLWYGADVGSKSEVGSWGLVSASPHTQYVDGLYGPKFWSQLSSLEHGLGSTGPLSEAYIP